MTPALLTRTSAPPSSFWTRWAAATIESRSVTSASMAIAPLPSSLASAWMRSLRRASSANPVAVRGQGAGGRLADA
jgi:hypothetical protein